MIELKIVKGENDIQTYSFDEGVEYNERFANKGSNMISLNYSDYDFLDLFSDFVNTFDKDNFQKIIFKIKNYERIILKENFGGLNYIIGQDGNAISERIDFWLQ